MQIKRNIKQVNDKYKTLDKSKLTMYSLACGFSLALHPGTKLITFSLSYYQEDYCSPLETGMVRVRALSLLLSITNENPE